MMQLNSKVVAGPAHRAVGLVTELLVTIPGTTGEREADRWASYLNVFGAIPIECIVFQRSNNHSSNTYRNASSFSDNFHKIIKTTVQLDYIA